MIPRAQLWMADAPDGGLDSWLEEALKAILSKEELAKAARFHFTRDRHTYLAAHALVRRALAQAGGLAPATWQFVTGAFGRPEVADFQGREFEPPLRFNLTHTRGLVACLVCPGADCGVDAECWERTVDVAALAGRVLTPPERRDLFCHWGTARRRRFFQYWTAKEAYVKARGVGLSFGLGNVGVQLTPKVALAMDPEGDEAAHWQLQLYYPTPRHVVSVALDRGTGPDFDVATRWVTVEWLAGLG